MTRYNRCLFYRYKDFWINFICSVIVVIICFILFSLYYFKFNFCYRYEGLVLREGDEYYVSILVNSSWFNLQNCPLVVDGKRVDYSILNISHDYTITDAGLRREVVLKFALDDDKKIQNNVLSLYFVRKLTFFKKIKEMIL